MKLTVSHLFAIASFYNNIPGKSRDPTCTTYFSIQAFYSEFICQVYILGLYAGDENNTLLLL